MRINNNDLSDYQEMNNSYFKHNLFNPSPPKLSFLSLWFGLLIDKKKKLMYSKLKKIN